MLKIGNRVEVMESFASNSSLAGLKGTIVVLNTDIGDNTPVGVEFDKGFDKGHNLNGAIKSSRGWWGRENELRLISSESNIMDNIKKAVKDLLTPEPKKSLMKVGLINEQGDLTTDGKDVVLQWLFEENQDAIIENIVNPLVEAQKKSKD